MNNFFPKKKSTFGNYSLFIILWTLEAISNLLGVYSCLPCNCLLKRVTWVYDSITSGNGELYLSEKTNVDMLVTELEAFLGNSWILKRNLLWEKYFFSSQEVSLL